MYNWSTNEKTLKKSPEAHVIWRLEQLINFGLNGRRLEKKQLKKYWNRLNIDPSRRAYLKMLLK